MTRHIALIGCGAIARAFYLPALVKLRDKFDHIWLVDPRNGSEPLAVTGLDARSAGCLGDIDDEVQFAIVATPNESHYPVACEALSRGAHILIEKPFVVRPEDGRRLVDAASANNLVIAVNQTRRLYPLARELRLRIASGEFGSLMSIVHREGTKLRWPFESGAAFNKGAWRTGVIMDFGVHVIDFYHYLLQPRWTLISAIHDGFGGPEGLADMSLQADDAEVSMCLSRYYPQENIARLRFERAEVSFGVHENTQYSVRVGSGTTAHCAKASAGVEHSHAEALLLNFLAACEGREQPVCSALASLPVIDILDQVYQHGRCYSPELGAV